MRYFSVQYEWHTRPLYRKGRLKRIRIAFAALDQTEAYKLAQEDGKARFPRHKWRVVGCEELTVPNAKETA